MPLLQALTVEPPLCSDCLHRLHDFKKFTCTVYPGGIPMGIIRSEIDHRLPYRGNNSIQFEIKAL